MNEINADRSEQVKYDYADFSVYIRKDLLSIFPGFAADSHWHEDIELIAVISGSMLYNVNGTVVTLNEGEGIIVNSRHLHYGFSENRTECEYICILFHPLLLCSSKMFENLYVNPVISGAASYIHLSPKLCWQRKIIGYVFDIYNKKDTCTAPLNTLGLIYLLWNELAENTDYILGSGGKSHKRLSVLKDMITYIHEHYNEKITLQNIASAGHISKRTCGVVFAEYLNKTPIEFLVDYRLRKSIELMQKTDMTVLEICYEAGFSGASYYAEVFRKHFGKSPTEYRKEIL